MNIIEAMEAPVNPDLGVLIVPKHDKGDDRIEWDPKQAGSVEAARKHFIDLKALNYKAYRVDPKNNAQGETMKEFDAQAGKIVMVPPFAGG